MSGTNSFYGNSTLDLSLSHLATKFATQPLGTLYLIEDNDTVGDDDEPQADVSEPLTIGCTFPNGADTTRDFIPQTITPTRNTATRGADVPNADSAPDETIDNETNRQLLTFHSWTRENVSGVGELWLDPIGQGKHRLAVALGIQAERDTRDCLGDDADTVDAMRAGWDAHADAMAVYFQRTK